MPPPGDIYFRNFLVNIEFRFSIYWDLFVFLRTFGRILLIILQKLHDLKKSKECWPFLLAVKVFLGSCFGYDSLQNTDILDNTLLVYSVPLGSLIIMSFKVSGPPWKNEVTPQEISIQLGPPFWAAPTRKLRN